MNRIGLIPSVLVEAVKPLDGLRRSFATGSLGTGLGIPVKLW